MKRNLVLLFLSVLLIQGISAKSKDRIIDQPYWLFSTSELELKKVILTDTATILGFRVGCASHNWSLRSSVHLEANGKCYNYRSGKLFTRKDGEITEFPFSADSTNIGRYTIENDRYFFERDSLVLRFDPIPANTQYLDFIEGKESDSWKTYQIKMDGKPYPALLTEQEQMPDVPLSPYVPAAGKAILKGHIHGYNPSIMINGIGLFGNDYSLTGNLSDIKMKADSLGNFSFEGEISHPIPIWYTLCGKQMSALLIPGEVNELDFDVVANAAKRPFTTTAKSFLFKGKYALLNEALNSGYVNYMSYASEIAYLRKIVHMSFDEYVQYSWNKYQEAIKDITAKQNLNTQQREFMLLRAQAYYLQNRISYIKKIESGLYYSGMKKDSTNLSKYQKQFTLEDPHSKELNIFKDLKALYVIYDYNLMDYMEVNGLNRNEVYQWMAGLKKARELSAQINSLHPVTTPSTWKSIAPQYLPCLQQLNDTVLAKVKAMNQNTSEGVIKDAPNVPASQLIGAIVDQYKGKVVFIDCWATWCGPCRTGIRKMEPVKKEFEGKDIVFIYLTNETSDITTWMKDIKEMKGYHYRISKETWDKLPTIKAIPHYLLFNKEGKQILDQVGWSDRLIQEFTANLSKALE